MTALKEKFQKALDADLNTSLAITTLYDVLKADMHDAAKPAELLVQLVWQLPVR